MTPPENTDMENHDLRSRVVGLEHRVHGYDQRLSGLEVWQRQRDIESARHDEKWNAMEKRIDERFSGIEKSVGDIKSVLSRLNWLIVGGIIAAVIGFIVKGGLNI